MSIMENIKTTTKNPGLGNTATMQSLHEIQGPDVKPLQAALKSVKRQLEISDAVKQQAEAEYMDQQILKNLNDDDLNSSSPDNSTDPEMPDTTPARPSDASARILELKNKQNICRDIYSSILQGTSVLEGLAERANQLSAYLEKTEIEITHLESVDAHSSKLKSAATYLTTQHHELKTTIAEQKQQIAHLTTHKTSSRELIEHARVELGRLIEEKERLTSELQSQNAAQEKLDNDKLVLQEKIELLERGFGEVTAKHNASLQSIEELTDANQHKEKDLAKCRSKLADMDQAVERHRIDLADVRSRHENLSTTFIATKTKLDEATFLVESTNRECDEKVRRKEKRIAELEAQNQVLNRQVSLNEDVIAKLDHKLTGMEMASPTQGKSGTKKAASKPAKPTVEEQPKVLN